MRADKLISKINKKQGEIEMRKVLLVLMLLNLGLSVLVLINLENNQVPHVQTNQELKEVVNVPTLIIEMETVESLNVNLKGFISDSGVLVCQPIKIINKTGKDINVVGFLPFNGLDKLTKDTSVKKFLGVRKIGLKDIKGGFRITTSNQRTTIPADGYIYLTFDLAVNVNRKSSYNNGPKFLSFEVEKMGFLILNESKQ